MKKHFWKKAAALALVLSLFVSLLSVAAAEGTGTEGEEPAPDISLVSDVDTTEATGTEGEADTPSDVSLLSDVEPVEGTGAEEEEDTNSDNTQEPSSEGNPLEAEQAEQTDAAREGHEHTADLSQKYAASYTECGGGVKTEFYRCTVCGTPLNEDSSHAEYIYGTGDHTLGEKQPASYTECGGGYQTDYYVCSVCRRAVDAEGNDAEYVQGTGDHTLGSEKHAANYTTCGGGYKEDWYECTACRRPVNADGSTISYVQGTGVHTPGGEKHEASYSPCNGGYNEDWYECTACQRFVNAEGNPVTYVQGTDPHNLEKRAGNYTPCNGGFLSEYYVCADCGRILNADGSEVTTYVEGTGKHTPGDKISYGYTECGGGYATDGYICTVCGRIVDADGIAMERIEGTGRHTPGDELFSAAATSTPCNGGHETDYYYCTVCYQAVDADGNLVYWISGNGEHQTVYVPAAAPTYEEWGHQAYWECSVCHLGFADSAGKREIYENIWVPPLTREQEVKTEALTAVPETIAEQYPTVEAVQTALLNSAKSAGFQPDAANAGGVLLDVTLQIRNADGTLTPVTPEEFPAGGVTVVIPYPAGTDKNYTFFLTHMIAHGPRAGQIEVLTSVNGEDGLYVHFTSMSPVYVSYMLEAGAPVPETPAPETPTPETPTPETPAATPETSVPAAPVSTVPKTSDANHGAPWGMLALLSIGGLGALCIAGKKLRSF